MGRSKEFRNRVSITAYLESEEFAALEQIRWREHKGITDVVRLAVVDYIKAHANGNDTFKLDQWNEDPEFQAIPTILADKEKWTFYVDQCTREEKLRILKQTTFLRTYLSARL